MNASAPRWASILFAPQAPVAAPPAPARPRERDYQALPVDTFRPAKAKRAAAAATVAEPVMADAIRHVTVKPGDVLAMRAQPGDYYWKIARHFAPEEAVGAYAKDLIARNGGSSLVKVGQLLNLPLSEHADYKLQLAIAVQKVLQLRALFGDRTPELDWGSVEVSPGPVDAYWVSIREAGSETRRLFLVSDDLSGLSPGRFSVLSEAESRQYFPS